MPKFTEEEKRKMRAALRDFSQRKKNAPPSERTPVARPERFDFLPGFDAEGRKFPVKDEDDEDDSSDRQ